VEYIGERRASKLRSITGRGELCTDGGKRIVVHHEWGLKREGYGKERYIPGRSGID